MAITPVTASLEIDTIGTAVGTINTWLGTLTITTIYGFTCVPISNTKARIILLYA